MLKRILAIILTLALFVPNTSVFASKIAVSDYGNSWDYDNVEAEVNQIKNFISRGLYLEAIKVCEETLAWHELSQSDKTLLAELKWSAQESYNKYVESLSQETGSVSDTDNYKNDPVYNAYWDKLKGYSSNPEIQKLSYKDYFIYDINKDEMPELIVRTGSTPNDLIYEYFSYVNGMIVKIGERDDIRSSLMTYPSGNGIIVYGGAQGTYWLYLVSYVDGKLKGEEIIPASPMDVPLTKVIPESRTLTTDDSTMSEVSNKSTLDNYFRNNKVVLTNAQNDNEQYDDVTNEINQINNFISRGLYLQAIQVCEETLAWHKLSETDKASINALKTAANSRYNTYFESSKYYDATNEINQINNFISWGMYLEAIQVCEETLAWHTLSETDKFLINGLKSSAQNQYNTYLNNLEKNATKEYYMRDWGMAFTFLKKAPTPKTWRMSDGVEYIQVCSNNNEHMTISAYRIGNSYSNMGLYNVKTPSQVLARCVEYHREIDSQEDGIPTASEVLSNNATTVGSFYAEQTTFRTSAYYNYRPIGYRIYKIVAFQYGSWIYVIDAVEYTYSWGDDFWNKMELVRKSIRFY